MVRHNHTEEKKHNRQPYSKVNTAGSVYLLGCAPMSHSFFFFCSYFPSLHSFSKSLKTDKTMCLLFSMAMSIQVLLSLDRVDLARY